MMQLRNRITAFSALGNLISSFSEKEVQHLSRRVMAHNTWFTERNIRLALERIIHYLQKEELEKWLQPYQLPQENQNAKKIGLAFPAGHPAAGFHDFLTVLITGNELHAKLHTQDPVLIPFLSNELCQIEPEFRNCIFFDEMLKGMDGMILTETNGSFGYMGQYLKNTPHLLRKKRKSCAILKGTESPEELETLGQDITQYFGIDNRSVSKIFVPEGYDFTPLFEALDKYDYLKDHHKFANNYDYYKSVYLVNQVPHLDTGFLLFKDDRDFISPLSVVYYQTYKNLSEVDQKIRENQDQIEGIIGNIPPATIKFGRANQPELWEYAAKADTVAFLQHLQI